MSTQNQFLLEQSIKLSNQNGRLAIQTVVLRWAEKHVALLPRTVLDELIADMEKAVNL